MSNTEMASTPAPASDAEAPREDSPLKGGASQQAEGGSKSKASFAKPAIACLQMALAVTLFGLLAYQAHEIGAAQNGGTSGGNQTSGGSGGGNSTGSAGTSSSGSAGGDMTFSAASLHNAGLNAAGVGMLLFGLIFAVLQAVTALSMWLQLSYHLPHIRHSSIAGPLKVTMAIGFIAMGFACRSINLGAPTGGSMQHLRITHAIEAFIIINWFYVALVNILSGHSLSWDCALSEDHALTRKHTLSYTQFWLALILIALLSGYFQLWTEGYTVDLTPSVDLMTGFAILFAVLQGITGVAMMQQCGMGSPGVPGETVPGLLRVTNSFGVIAFGFACRTIYETSSASPGASAHLIAIESFVIINFIFSLLLSHTINFLPNLQIVWNFEVAGIKGTPGAAFGVLHLIFSIVLFGLIAGILENVTGNSGDTKSNGLNAAGSWMILFALLFSVLEFWTGVTFLLFKRLAMLNSSVAAVTSKVTLAFGALAFGFACRHINIGIRFPSGAAADKTAIVHAIESFIIINFFLTLLIDTLNNKGKIEY